jgi:hypothetical protein
MSNTGTLHKVIQAAHRTTYLNLVHEAFSRALHPRGLFRLCELLMSNKVVPALAPHVDVLATITGTTLDLLHVVIGGFRGFSFAALPPAAVEGITGPWSRPGEPTGEEAPARGGDGTLPSSAGGVGTLLPSSAIVLGGGVLPASPSLGGVLAAALAGADSPSMPVAAAAAAG